MTHEERKILKTIGTTIKNRRLELGMSKYRLSKLSQVQPRHITLIEEGQISPTIQTIESITEALGLSIAISKNKNSP